MRPKYLRGGTGARQRPARRGGHGGCSCKIGRAGGNVRVRVFREGAALPCACGLLRVVGSVLGINDYTCLAEDVARVVGVVRARQLAMWPP